MPLLERVQSSPVSRKFAHAWALRFVSQVVDAARLPVEERRLPAGANDTVKLTELNRFFFADYGFHGSRTNYYHRSNSYLNEVLDDSGDSEDEAPTKDAKDTKENK